MTTSTCTHCNRTLGADEFRPNPALKTGLDSWCKDCHRQAVRDARAKHGTKYNERRRGQLSGRSALKLVPRDDIETRAYLNAVLNDPCSYCGAPATELDHILPGVEDPENITAACRSCNARKQRLSLLGWMLRRRLIADGYDELQEQWQRAA